MQQQVEQRSTAGRVGALQRSGGAPARPAGGGATGTPEAASPAAAGAERAAVRRTGTRSGGVPLYTAEERERRDRSKWTKVQGVLAALQFFVFLGSVALVVRTLLTGEGLGLANASVVAKTLTLYAIMVTGALWEYDVYGKYLFAPAFFWEDVVSMGVIALHTAYLVALIGGLLPARELMLLALAAYATYVVNAGQFLVKFRRARLDRKDELAGTAADAPVLAAEGAR